LPTIVFRRAESEDSLKLSALDQFLSPAGYKRQRGRGRIAKFMAMKFYVICGWILLACGVAQAQSRLEAVDVSEFCDLVRKADSYHEKTVRIKTTYVVGSESSIVADPDCMGISGEGAVWVKFDSYFKYWSKSEVVKRFDQLLHATPKKADGSTVPVTARGLEVVFVGKFETHRRFGHLNSYSHQLTVYAIEAVKPISWMVNGEKYFTTWPDTP
jgi:hypothetical protein